MSEKEKLACGAFALASIPLLVIATTCALQAMWGWHVTPLIGLPAPTKTTVFALMLFVYLFRPMQAQATKDPPKEVPEVLGKILGHFLFIGLATLASWWLR